MHIPSSSSPITAFTASEQARHSLHPDPLPAGEHFEAYSHSLVVTLASWAVPTSGLRPGCLTTAGRSRRCATEDAAHDRWRPEPRNQLAEVAAAPAPLDKSALDWQALQEREATRGDSQSQV